jgi:hypothetical protein
VAPQGCAGLPTDTTPFRVTRVSCASLVAEFAGSGGAFWSDAANAHRCAGIVSTTLDQVDSTPTHSASLP